MGSSKKQTIGYWYKYIWLDGWCWGPVDAVLEWRAGDRAAWQGRATANAVLTIDKKELWGGEKQEGGVVGDFEIMMGAADQMPNAWLEANLGGPQPGYRGILTTLWRGGKFGAFNPYPKSRALKVERILAGWPDDDPWYPAKAVIPCGCEDGFGPILNGWVVKESSATRLWDYGFTANDTPFATGYNITYWHHENDRYYLSGPTSDVSHIDDTQLLTSDFTAESGFVISAGGGDLIFGDPDYIYVCGGIQPIIAMDVPYSGPSYPTLDSQSRANTGVFFDGVLYVASIYSQYVTYSGDQALTWNTKANPFADVVGGNTNSVHLKIMASGKMAIAFQDGGGTATPYKLRLGHSDDQGDTWSYATHNIPIPNTSSSYFLFSGGLLQFDNKLFYITTDGYCGISVDGGETWVAKTQLPAFNPWSAAVGAGKIVVGCGYNRAYESVDEGDTWTLITLLNAPTGSVSDIVSVGYLGLDSAPIASNCFNSMNPAHMLYESIVLPPEMGGMGEPAGLINAASFEAAADKLFTEGFGLCTVVMGDETPEEFQQRILDIIGGSISQSRETGQYYLDLMRDDYDLGSLLILGDDDIKSFQWEPGNISSAVNQVQVEWFDPQAKENRITSPIQSAGAIQAVGGVIAETYTHREIPLESLALRVAEMKLRVKSLPLGRFEISCTRKPWRLRKGQFFRLQYLAEGFADVVCLALDIDYGDLKDGSIKIIAMQEVFGLPTASYVAPVAAVDVVGSTAPVPAENRLAFEVPYLELASTLSTADKAVLATDTGFLGVVATPPNANSVNFALNTATGSEDYVDRGTGDWCPSALIVEAGSQTATAFTLSGGSNLDRVVVGSWALWSAEIVRIDAIDPTLLTLTLGRGCGDTVSATHAAGERIYFCGDWLAGDSREYVDAEVVRAKLLTRTISGVLPLPGTSNNNVTMAHRQIRPYPPGLLSFKDDLNTVTGLVYPVELAGAITAGWAHRDRLLQDDQVVDASAASIGPEVGTTYTVTYYQPPGTLITSESGIGGASATPYTFPADGPAQITVEASRAGYTSWQMHNHSFDYYRFPRVTKTALDGRIATDGSARKIK